MNTTNSNTYNVKYRIIFLVQLPPPVHGVTVVNKSIISSKVLNDRFVVDVFPLRFSQTFQDMYGGEFKKSILGVKTAILLFKKLLFSRPDMIYFTLSPIGGAFLRDCLYVAIVKFFRIPVTYHLHGKGIAKKSKNKLLYHLYKFVFNKAKVIHLSNFLYIDIEKFVSNNDCYFVKNGISSSGIFSKHNKNETRKVPIIGYLANMNPRKGIYDLLDGFLILQKKGLAVDLFLAGEWTPTVNKKNLQKYISDNGGDLAHVTMFGPLYGEAKNTFFNQLDIFAYPTCHDAFPLVVLEAMSHSLPIVTTTEGAIRDMVQDGINGHWVAHHSPAQISNALEALILNPILREKFGQESWNKFTKEFTFEKFESNLCQTLEHILMSNAGNI